MILFYDDWKKYPKARIHYETRNKSWLRIAALFKRMGIKNHAFMLAIHNPDIAELDPYDPNLTTKQKLLIVKEIKENPWYFFREVLRLPAAGSPVQFKANRANISMIWLFFNHITQLTILPRQVGKSVTILSIKAYLANNRGISLTEGILTKDESLRDKSSRQIRDIIETLPKYLQLMTKRDVKNSEKITVKALNNTIYLLVPGTSKTGAEKRGRGMTLPVVTIDEFAFIRYIEYTIPAMLVATTAAREQAKKAGLDYGTILTTTPGKLNTPEGKYAYKIYKGSMRWSEKLFDVKNNEELVEILDKNTSGKDKFNIMLVEYNHRQLGYTDDWLVERIKASLLDNPDDIEAELLNQWKGGSYNSPISKEIMEIIIKHKRTESRTEIYDNGYVIRWYVSEQRIHEMMRDGFLIAGLDTSDAVGKDDLALVIRYSKSGEVVATGRYNETNLIVFSDFIAKLLIKYDKLILIPERRSSASAIIDNIIKILSIENINPFRKIFNWVYHDYYKYKDKYKEVFSKHAPSMETINELRKHFGFATSGTGRSSRSGLYGNTFNASIKYTADKIYDPDLIEQTISLTIRNGRIDHPEDGHDDMVISWLLGFWFMTQSENLNLYGIKTDNILKDIIDNELLANSTDKDLEYIKKQELLKNKIEALVNLLKKENDEYIALTIYNKIKMLENKIDAKILKNFHIDNLLNDVKILKKIKKLQNRRVA